MKRRNGFEVKKKILGVLKESGEVSLGEIERKVNTNNLTVLNHLKELEYFDKVVVVRHRKSVKTGRPYTTVRLKK